MWMTMLNWNSHSVDAVSKERIWREHVINEKNTARIHEEFRCNPLKKDPPTAESISKRPARFLDKTAVIMDMLEKRLQRANKNNSSTSAPDSGRYLEMMSGRSNESMNLSGRSKIQQNYQLQTRGMYSFNDSNPNKANENSSQDLPSVTARGMQSKGKLPPIINTSTSSSSKQPQQKSVTINASSASGTSEPVSPRTKRILAAHDFDGLYSQAQLTPREKYAVPQTAMQEIGWWNQSLITNKEQEPRFKYGLSSCDVTKNGSAFVGSRKN